MHIMSDFAMEAPKFSLTKSSAGKMESQGPRLQKRGPPTDPKRYDALTAVLLDNPQGVCFRDEGPEMMETNVIPIIKTDKQTNPLKANLSKSKFASNMATSLCFNALILCFFFRVSATFLVDTPASTKIL